MKLFGLLGRGATRVPLLDLRNLAFSGEEREVEVECGPQALKEAARVAGKRGSVTDRGDLVPEANGAAVNVRLKGRVVGRLREDQALGLRLAMIEAGAPGGGLSAVRVRVTRSEVPDTGTAYAVTLLLPQSLATYLGAPPEQPATPDDEEALALRRLADDLAATAEAQAQSTPSTN